MNGAWIFAAAVVLAASLVWVTRSQHGRHRRARRRRIRRVQGYLLWWIPREPKE